MGVEDEVFIHPSSVIFETSPPGYVAFQEIVQTSRPYLKCKSCLCLHNVSVPDWLYHSRDCCQPLMVKHTWSRPVHILQEGGVGGFETPSY